MRLGFNLLLWTTHVTEEHWPIIDQLIATGYDGVEIPMFEGEVAHYERLSHHLKDIGVPATGIGILPEGMSAVSADAGERRAALDHIKWLIDCTAAIGGDIMAGPWHQTLGQFTGKGQTADELKRCAEVHKQAAQYAAESGITLAVEPLNRFECYFLTSAKQAAALCEAVDEPNYGYLYDGWMTVEAFGSALPDLAAATKIWRPLFASEADVYEGAFRLMREGWDSP